MSDLHGAVRDLLGDNSGWDLIFRRTGYTRLVHKESKLVVIDPRVDDWLQAVEDAADRVRQIQRCHLTLVPNNEQDDNE